MGQQAPLTCHACSPFTFRPHKHPVHGRATRNQPLLVLSLSQPTLATQNPLFLPPPPSLLSHLLLLHPIPSLRHRLRLRPPNNRPLPAHFLLSSPTPIPIPISIPTPFPIRRRRSPPHHRPRPLPLKPRLRQTPLPRPRARPFPDQIRPGFRAGAAVRGPLLRRRARAPGPVARPGSGRGDEGDG